MVHNERDGADSGRETDGTSSPLTRRTVLRATGGTMAAGAAIGAFAGSATAWERFEVDFKGCSEVWMVVGSDLRYDPPAVAHVVVATGDEMDCHVVEFTEDAATTIPGQFGDAPVVKYAPDDGKILGVIKYNYNGENRFAKPSCLLVNENQCANTPNAPDVYESDCVQAAYEGHWDGNYWESNCVDDVIGATSGTGGGGGEKARGTGKGSGSGSGNGNGPGNGNGKGH